MSQESDKGQRPPPPKWVENTFKATAFVLVMLVMLFLIALLMKGLLGLLGIM
jgi:hypothetical protein